MDKGHCGLPIDRLRVLAVDLLDVPEKLLRAALRDVLTEGEVALDTIGEKHCLLSDARCSRDPSNARCRP